MFPLTWRIKRWAISAFVGLHVAALIVWNLPNCAIRTKVAQSLTYYLNPTGLWQCWSMFAPDPVQNTTQLEAIVVDRNGLYYHYEYPKLTDMDVWEKALRVRQSKFISYLASDEYQAHREFTARHVVRALDLPAESFPVGVELRYVVRETPKPGNAPDPMAPTRIEPIKAYRFPTWQEARP